MRTKLVPPIFVYYYANPFFPKWKSLSYGDAGDEFPREV